MAEEGAVLLSDEELEALVSQIDFDFPLLFNPLEPVFETIARQIVTWSVWVGNAMARFFTTIGGTLWDFLQNLIAQVVNSAVGVGSWLSERITEAVAWVSDNILRFFAGIPDLVRLIWGKVDNWAVDLGESIWAPI